MNSLVLLGLPVEAGTLNQPTIYIEKAAELERPDMMGFTVPDGLDPDGRDVASNFRQGGPDQQVEEMGRSIDGLARQPAASRAQICAMNPDGTIPRSSKLALSSNLASPGSPWTISASYLRPAAHATRAEGVAADLASILLRPEKALALVRQTSRNARAL